MKTKDELIVMGRQWLEHAPPDTGHYADGLVGWKGDLEVCVKCTNRILQRGCDMKQLASEPVWEPDTVKCDLCQPIARV